jgi:hypothetical protein
MPIKSIVEGLQLHQGMPKLGKLFKGSEQQEKNGKAIMGKDLDYFRVALEPEYEYLQEAFVDLYGDAPRAFAPVFFYGATVDEVFSHWMEEWNGSGTLLHRCDEEHQVRWWNESSGMYMSAKVSCDAPKCNCKATGRLNVILPDFIEATGELGYFVVETHSKHDIITLYSRLLFIAQSYGTLLGVTFEFGRRDREISRPVIQNGVATGKRAAMTKSLLYVKPTQDFTLNKFLPGVRALTDALPQLEAGVDLETGEIVTDDVQRYLRPKSDKPRRIGAPPASEKQPQLPPPAEPLLPDWWDAFREWSTAYISAEDLPRALNVTDTWRDDKRTAVAAVLAFHCQYDDACIDKVTAGKQFAAETWDTAREIAARARSQQEDSNDGQPT